MLVEKLESSANKWKSRRSEQRLKSFMYNKNNKGPKTDPWGTPQDIVCLSDTILSRV